MMAFLARKAVVLGLLLAALAVPVRAADISKYLPNDSEIVVTVNVKQILESQLIQKHALEMAKAALQGNDEARRVLEALGLDPFKDVISITMAGPNQKDKPDQATIIVQGRFDARKIEATAAEVAKKDADKLTIHKIGGDTVYEFQQGDKKETMFATLIDAATIVAASSKDYVAEALDKRAGKKQTQIKKGLQDLLDRSDDKQSISISVLAGAVNAMDVLKNNEKATTLLGKMVNLTGGITISDEIKADFTVETKDKEAALELNKTITAGLGFVALFAAQDPNLAPLADVVAGIKVKPQDTSVQIKVLVSKETIEKAVNKAGGQ